ncbi:ATP-binding protein [Aneurinibacillus sp. Ricciae_BoGa-3]|uniref:ATP-binding protein n=1 Tax=Aneurinibacillus sp. Ricciae_BoGa-3 TaxID=3022697 RepID=UPI0023425945|nr:ATP-binding protein [Aneurinibacillus sp. Ricciae_BoGa-3]WCK56021.1 ATP-binding protein [Aneurinibacillus sp. Ricciae_BoGa-3]
MFYNRIVGKLWITIIGLVAVVLMVLSLTLMQAFDRFYQTQRSADLTHLAQKISNVLEVSKDQPGAIRIARELVDVYGTRMVVLGSHGEVAKTDFDTANPDFPQIQLKDLQASTQIKKAFSGNIGVARTFFKVKTPNGIWYPQEYLIVAVPIHAMGDSNVLVLYQTLDELRQTTNQTTWLIFYAAIIGIILTTFFAFFLSSRITKPLRSMKKAADSYARGDFSTQIAIRSNDEIGDLAATFNNMAGRLNGLIRALSREKEQLSSILRSMVDGVFKVNKDGEIVVVNPPGEEILRSWAYEHRQANADAAQADPDASDTRYLPVSMQMILQQVIKDEGEVMSDIKVQGRIYSVVMTPLYDRKENEKHVRGAVAVLRDMTEERTLDKLRKDFLANVSHELRTPLAMLQGYSEAIIDDIAETAEEKKELAGIIYDESLRMTRLVNELLDLAKMEAGHIQLRLEHNNIWQLEEKAIRKFNGVAREQDVELQLDWREGTTREFLFDPDRMEQVLTNLIDNALRHTPSGGRVKLITYQSGEKLIIEVADTGSGIPVDDLPFVFERFYKADKARTRGRAGTGLGLSIVKNIVESHGASIRVHSRLNEGTTFHIEMPLTEEGRGQ